MKKIILVLLVLFAYNSYAQQISQLPIATGKGQGMFVPVVDVGITKKLSVSNILSYSDSLKTVIDGVLTLKQAALLSGSNIKTVNGSSLLGSGDIVIAGGSGAALDAQTVSVKDYGAIGDGIANENAAFNAAVATGKNIFVPSGTYLLNNFVQLLPNKTMYGVGRTSIIKNVSNIYAIALANGSEVYNLKFTGGGKNTAGLPFNMGVHAYQSIGFKVKDCWFEDFSGVIGNNGGGGLYALQVFPGNSNGGQVTSCSFINNNVGLNLGQRAEYITVSSCTMGQNNTGLYISGGNNTIQGCILQDNVINIRFGAGTNNGKCVISATLANHATGTGHCLYIEDVVSGITFIGSTFNVGNIFISTSPKLKFIGCDFVGAGGTLTVTTSDIYIFNSRYPKTPTVNAYAVTLGTGGTITEANNLDF